MYRLSVQVAGIGSVTEKGSGVPIPEDSQVSEFEFRNGMRIVLDRVRNYPLVTACMNVGLGWRHGPPHSRLAPLLVARFMDTRLRRLAYRNSMCGLPPIQDIGFSVGEESTHHYALAPSSSCESLLWIFRSLLGVGEINVDTLRNADAKRLIERERGGEALNPEPVELARIWRMMNPRGDADHIPELGGPNSRARSSSLFWLVSRGHGPSNATLIVSGDIPGDAEELIERYYGPLRRRPGRVKVEGTLAVLGESVSLRGEPSFGRSKLTCCWHSAGIRTREDAAADVLSDMISSSGPSGLLEEVGGEVSLGIWPECFQRSRRRRSMFVCSMLGRSTDGERELLGRIDGLLEHIAEGRVSDALVQSSKWRLELMALRRMEGCVSRAVCISQHLDSYENMADWELIRQRYYHDVGPGDVSKLAAELLSRPRASLFSESVFPRGDV